MTNFDFETVAEANRVLGSMFDLDTKEGQRQMEGLVREATIQERDAAPPVNATYFNQLSLRARLVNLINRNVNLFWNDVISYERFTLRQSQLWRLAERKGVSEGVAEMVTPGMR